MTPAMAFHRQSNGRIKRPWHLHGQAGLQRAVRSQLQHHPGPRPRHNRRQRNQRAPPGQRRRGAKPPLILTIEPGGDAAVEMAVASSAACSDTGAICTADERTLTGIGSITVPGPYPPAPDTGVPSAQGQSGVVAKFGHNPTRVLPVGSIHLNQRSPPNASFIAGIFLDRMPFYRPVCR